MAPRLTAGGPDTTARLGRLPADRDESNAPPPAQEELNRCWARLAEADVPLAYSAVALLCGLGEPAVPFLAQKLRDVVAESSCTRAQAGPLRASYGPGL